MRVILLLAGLALFLLPAPNVSAQEQLDEQVIRVSLLGQVGPHQVDLSAETAQLTFATTAEGSVFATTDTGETVRIRERSNELALELPDDEVLYVREVFVKNNGGGTVTISSPDELFSSRSYQGALHIYRSNSAAEPLRLINHVPLETYVASVVSSEYGFDDVEGARAMAVLARTYALFAHTNYGDEFDHVDHTMSQVYRGADDITSAAREATRATAGEILTYNDEPIQAVYFSSSGGHTANNEDLWASDPSPYLRGREDSFDSQSPHSEWTVRVDRPELLRRLSRSYGFQVRGFSMGERSDDGRLKDITLLGASGERANLSANEFRLFANQQLPDQGIRSTLFDARREGDVYIFEGRGHGHGVGLNQYGALEMSRQGYSYEDILSYYFADVALVRGDESMALANSIDDELIGDVSEEAPESSAAEPDTTTRQTRIGW